MEYNCRVCGVNLTSKNWYPSYKKGKNKICNECCIVKQRNKRKNYTPEQRKYKNSQHNKARRIHYHILKAKIINLLGMKCKVCGFSNFKALQIDHIKGSGLKEKRKFKQVIKYYEHILCEIENGSTDYQLLCANHNRIKAFDELNYVDYSYLLGTEQN